MNRTVFANGLFCAFVVACIAAGPHAATCCVAEELIQLTTTTLNTDSGAGPDLVTEYSLPPAAYSCCDGGESGDRASCCSTPRCGAACGCNHCRKSSLTARFGFLLMKRESPDNVAIVTDNAGAGPVVLNGADFDFDFEPGFETSLIYDNHRLPAQIEARFFWMNEWSDSRPATGLTNPVVNTTPVANSFGNLTRANYKSQLQTFELHFRKQVRPNTTLLAGFRYVSFDEDLDTLIGGADRFWWGTENDLFGFQLGAERVLYNNCCGLKLEGIIKAGVYGNDANVGTQVLLVEQSGVSQGSGMDHVSFLGELGLIGSYDLSCCWTLRAGYQAMWLDGVLVATNQVPVTNNAATTIGFDYTDAFFHGGMVQLERRW